MSKAFTKETDKEEEWDDLDPLPAGVKNLMTPQGFAILQEELEKLIRKERPAVVEIVSWAAGNGDRSENGDYIYNKKRLREIDRRIRYLTKRLEDVEVVDPARQQGLKKVFFGATVTYVCTDGLEQTVTLVGVDEANMDEGKINWQSPVARALMKAEVGGVVEVKTEAGSETIEILSIRYGQSC
jgi:transcription elongation factor GreB